MSEKVLLHPRTGSAIEVERDIAEQSHLIKNMLAHIEGDVQSIPLPNISSDALKKVLEYCDHHKNDPPVPEASDDKEKSDEFKSYEMDEWDRNFCDVDDDTLFELLHAANYLNIKPLLDIICRTIADRLKDKSRDEIVRIFGINENKQQV